MFDVYSAQPVLSSHLTIVEGTSVINGHKCNKVTSVIKIGHKCNKVKRVLNFGHCYN